MPPRADGRMRRIGLYALVAGVALLGVLPGYLALSPSWRPTAIRLACAAVVVTVCLRVVGVLRRAAAAGQPSIVDESRAASASVVLDERFVRIRDDLTFGTRSQHYFQTHVWPRLVGLGLAGVAAPAGRGRRGRRGPSWSTLDRLLGELERRLVR
jgi:hypothetical protein